jgi:fatty-acyl-CoA synthase
MDYKIPHYVKFVTEFPATVTGKIQKFRMRELSTMELGLATPGQGAENQPPLPSSGQRA